MKIRRVLVSISIIAFMLLIVSMFMPEKAEATPGYYLISFNYSGVSGEGNFPSQFEVRAGAKFSIPTQIPTRKQYTFKGWKEKNTGKKYSAGQGNLLANQNYVLYPIWEFEAPTGSSIILFN